MPACAAAISALFIAYARGYRLRDRRRLRQRNSRGAGRFASLCCNGLGYDLKDGKSGGRRRTKNCRPFFCRNESRSTFLFLQSDLEAASASQLDLDIDFSSYHAGDPGKLFSTPSLTRAKDCPDRTPRPSIRPKAKAPIYPSHLIKLDSADAASEINSRVDSATSAFTQLGATRCATVAG